MSLDKRELMPFRKFAIYCLNISVHDSSRQILGTFKSGNEVVKGDNFEATLVGDGSPEETYKAYLKWYNHLREDHECEREYVYAEFGKGDE